MGDNKPATLIQAATAVGTGITTHVGAVPALHHFTCSHFVIPITATGAVVPHRHPAFPSLGRVAWFTTDVWADPDRTGLTSRTLACDRTKHRFRVTEAAMCLPWIEVRNLMVSLGQPGFERETIHDFEYYAAPETWWISAVPVPVVRA